jgi:hypothetical protein
VQVPVLLTKTAITKVKSFFYRFVQEKCHKVYPIFVDLLAYSYLAYEMRMITVVLFNWLLIGHLVGDYILQTNWMQRKSKEFLPLLIHSTIYTAAVALLALLAGGLSWRGVALIFVSHLILDQRKFIEFWASKITGSANINWLKVMLDQSWHIVVLGIATLL